VSTPPPDFESLVGGDDLDAQERARLLAAHEALLIAGPPAELPPALVRAPRPEAVVVALPSGRRRSTLLVAAAIALVAFALGTATSRKSGDAFAATWTHELRGTAAAPHAWAAISGTKKDRAGNWKMLLKTTGLPQVHGKKYYVLWLTKHGRPVAQCGTFLVGDGTTVATFVEPYEVQEFDGWAVTLWRGPKTPTGPALLRTAAV
jgi:hypothetical protein